MPKSSRISVRNIAVLQSDTVGAKLDHRTGISGNAEEDSAALLPRAGSGPVSFPGKDAGSEGLPVFFCDFRLFSACCTGGVRLGQPGLRPRCFHGRGEGILHTLYRIGPCLPILLRREGNWYCASARFSFAWFCYTKKPGE